MVKRSAVHVVVALTVVAGAIAACSVDERAVAPRSLGTSPAVVGDAGTFAFAPLPSSAVCTVSGGDPVNPLVLATGLAQQVIASEPDFPDVPDMNTQNETGPHAGRYLYRVHEVGSNGALSVTDLQTGTSNIVAQRADWESLDPTVWTPWGTILIGEETNAAGLRDPQYPQSVGGLVYEVFLNPADPTTMDSVVARPAIGAKSHEGMRFDRRGNLYSISERTPGYIFKFVPDRKGDLSSGQTYVLRLTQDLGNHTGPAEWVPLDRSSVQIDASLAADSVQATSYGRPEDVEIGTSSGHSRDGDHVLYVAVTSENRVLAINLEGLTVSDYVAVGQNVGSDFLMPDNLALDRSGNLYITEDPGGSFSGGKTEGDDIWVAASPARGVIAPSPSVKRIASLTDCDAEPTGVYVDLLTRKLYVNVQHRGGDRLDKVVAITQP